MHTSNTDEILLVNDNSLIVMGMNKITATYMKINESILQDDTTFI